MTFTLAPEATVSEVPEAVVRVRQELIKPYEGFERQIEALATYLGDGAGLIRPLVDTMNDRIEPGIGTAMATIFDLCRHVESLSQEVAEGERAVADRDRLETEITTAHTQMSVVSGGIRTLYKAFSHDGLTDAANALAALAAHIGINVPDVYGPPDGSAVALSIAAAAERAEP